MFALAGFNVCEPHEYRASSTRKRSCFCRDETSLTRGLVAPKSSSSGEASHNFFPGDMVEVCEGELIHLLGKIISIDGNKITMVPKHEDLKVCSHSVELHSGCLRGDAASVAH